MTAVDADIFAFGDPKRLVVIAVGFLFVMTALLVVLLVNRGLLVPAEQADERLTKQLGAAVEAAIMTRKHVQRQREIIHERLNDPDAKLSMGSHQDLTQVLQFTEERLQKAQRLLDQPDSPKRRG
uniref:Uncharacterized protein n=1 Tax=Neobodo designis TaxID=312471 RepID=A0A7S1Q4U7_NEODS|mmetsp:Transcript_33233/g.102604  ORF Transcript_33233/g.102604 Transcript_33233/m.102604 type:complete len:125 (+) Transcript_33233:42-416(+)